jgi:hypothetical protein
MGGLWSLKLIGLCYLRENDNFFSKFYICIIFVTICYFCVALDTITFSIIWILCMEQNNLVLHSYIFVDFFVII